jgi:uncharacterized protein (TIGR02453 family)
MTTIFTSETFDFLRDLRANNARGWFDAHRAIYTASVLGPLLALVEALAEPMLDIDSAFVVAPAVGKTISRIYRDTRFSKDKSPFRDHMWITFKRPGADWQDAPGYYCEINPDGFSYGMGLYAPTRETMDAFRGVLEKTPAVFHTAMQGLEEFQVGGESYKRPLNPALPAELQPWYQRKSIYWYRSGSVDARLTSADFAPFLAGEFARLAPLYAFFRGLRGG